MITANKQGFTLVELMIVIGIIAVLAVIAFANFSGTDSEYELRSANIILQADINKIITWAETGRIEETSGNVPLGYGILPIKNFDRYGIYAEFSGDYRYGSGDVLIGIVDLKDDEQINNITFSSCTPGGGYCDLQIETYTGDIYGDGVKGVDLTMDVEHTVSGDIVSFAVDGKTGVIK